MITLFPVLITASGFWGFVGRIEFEGLALPLHALNTSLYHIALDTLIGGLGGGTDGCADGLDRADADIVALGVLTVVEMCIRDRIWCERRPATGG